MKDEQIRDSLRNLAAAAPNVDIWPRISGRVESQPPRRSLWPHLRLRPLLVGLNAIAIAALLFTVLGVPGWKGGPATETVVSNTIANTPTPCIEGYPIQLDARGCPPNAVAQAVSTPLNLPPSDAQRNFTLAEFAGIMYGNPAFRLPTHLPANYSINGINMTNVTHSMTGTVKVSDCCWKVSYQDYVPGQNDTHSVTLDASNHVWVTNPGDPLKKRVSLIDPFVAIGDARYEIFGGTTMSDDTRLTARYRRPDRIIELYNDTRLEPALREYAYIFFATGNTQYPLVRYTIVAPYNVTDDELLHIADSIEPVDQQHLAKYEGANPAVSHQSNNGPTQSFYPVPHTYTVAEFAQIMANEPDFMLPTTLPGGYKLGNINMATVRHEITGTGTMTATEEQSRCCWYVEYQKDIAGQDQQILRLHMYSQARITHAGDGLSRSVTVSNPLDAVGNPSYEIFGGYTADNDRLTARYRRADRVIELYHDVRLGSSQNRFAYVYFANQEARNPLTQISIYAPENVSDAELLKMGDSIERVDPSNLERYK